MTPCPEEAMPVVEILRRDVRRPEELPKPDEHTGRLRWETSRYIHGCCPIGLHPKVEAFDYPDPLAEDAAYCLEIGRQETWCFLHWWDSLREQDAKSAVEFIWPTKGA